MHPKLQKIQQQIEQLKTELLHVKKLPIKVNFFDNTLFYTASQNKNNELGHYIKEVEMNFEHFSRSINNNASVEKLNYLSQKLSDQILALKREIATQEIRKKESFYYYETPQQKQQRYARYLTRLQQLQQHECNKLLNATCSLDKIKYQQNIETFDERIMRCQRAIWQLNNKQK